MSKKKILFIANCTTKNYGAATLFISTVEALHEMDPEIIYFKESLSKDLDIKRLTGIYTKGNLKFGRKRRRSEESVVNELTKENF